MISIPPTRLTTEELMRYAQMQVDKKEPLPPGWTQELINRLAFAGDAAATARYEALIARQAELFARE